MENIFETVMKEPIEIKKKREQIARIKYLKDRHGVISLWREEPVQINLRGYLLTIRRIEGETGTTISDVAKETGKNIKTVTNIFRNLEKIEVIKISEHAHFSRRKKNKKNINFFKSKFKLTTYIEEYYSNHSFFRNQYTYSDLKPAVIEAKENERVSKRMDLEESRYLCSKSIVQFDRVSPPSPEKSGGDVLPSPEKSGGDVLPSPEKSGGDVSPSPEKSGGDVSPSPEKSHWRDLDEVFPSRKKNPKAL